MILLTSTACEKCTSTVKYTMLINALNQKKGGRPLLKLVKLALTNDLYRIKHIDISSKK